MATNGGGISFLPFLGLALVIGGVGFALARPEEEPKPPNPLPPGGRPPGPVPKREGWENNAVVQPGTSIVVVGDGAAGSLGGELTRFASPHPVTIFANAVADPTTASNQFDAYLTKNKIRRSAQAALGLTPDVVLVTTTNFADPSSFINSLLQRLHPLDALVWVPMLVNADLVGGMQAQFVAARQAGARLVGIVPGQGVCQEQSPDGTVCTTPGPGWGGSVWNDISNMSGIPAAKRI